MRIICDTNIWYDFGNKTLKIEDVKHLPLSPTYIALSELLRTEGVLDKPHLLRPSIQALFHFQDYKLFDAPIIHLAKMNGYTPDEVTLNGTTYLLEASERFAKGFDIAESKRTEFIAYVQKEKQPFEEAAKLMNEVALSIKKRLPNKSARKKHKNDDSIEISKNLLSRFVAVVTKEKSNLDGFDFSRIELLLYTLDFFFKEIETTTRTVKANDFKDLFFLAYVQPGDFYWTHEKSWKQFITSAGMEKYLYEKVDKSIVQL